MSESNEFGPGVYILDGDVFGYRATDGGLYLDEETFLLFRALDEDDPDVNQMFRDWVERVFQA